MGPPRGTLEVRSFETGDLGRVVELWRREGLVPTGPDGLNVDEAADLMVAEDTEAIVVERAGEIAGTAVGAASGTVGWVLRVVGDEDACSRLLDELEGRLADRGARKLVVRLAGDGGLRERFERHGYAVVDEAAVLERAVGATARGRDEVAELGGRMIAPDLWDRLEGMEEVKDVIERRIILPLAEPELADRHGVTPPGAVLLFGPPGTGKTTFAKGIASRLGWPFVPIETSGFVDAADEAGRQRLARTFDRLLDLPAAVAFVDEVEDIASVRLEQRRVGSQVTNEFLIQIPRLREAPPHLLVCATNRVGRLDPAFRRPGRFDYLLPVGPPDATARRAIWRGYVEDITDEEVDLAALVDASERFTPADIEFAARKAAQLAFEKEYFEGAGPRASTDDFLAAIRETRPTLTDEMIEDFEDDRERYARS